MSQASAGGGKRAEMSALWYREALRTRSFAKVAEDPRAVVEQELGRNCLRALEVRVVEECTEHLPGASQRLGGWRGGEISDRDLEAVAGGAADIWGSTDKTCVGQPCQISARPLPIALYGSSWSLLLVCDGPEGKERTSLGFFAGRHTNRPTSCRGDQLLDSPTPIGQGSQTGA